LEDNMQILTPIFVCLIVRINQWSWKIPSVIRERFWI